MILSLNLKDEEQHIIIKDTRKWAVWKDTYLLKHINSMINNNTHNEV